jgi:2-polyprenyl-3-methyl-5-hydroxy-6-metoxy-1,4-benzoquinol methylase
MEFLSTDFFVLARQGPARKMDAPPRRWTPCTPFTFTFTFPFPERITHESFMMPSQRCPMCHSDDVEVQETLSVAHITQLYRQSFQIDVAAEFGSEESVRFCRCSQCDLRFFDPQASGSEAFYNALQAQPWYYQEQKEEFELARRHIKPTDSVLEVGGGAGAFAQGLKSREYLGLELSRDAIERAKKLGVNMLQQSIQEHAGSHQQRYDVVCAFQVLEHISDVHDFIASCAQCLKPGGHLIYSVPSADSFLSICRNNATNMPPHHITHWSDSALASLAGIFDLQLVAITHDIISDCERGWLAKAVAERYLDGLLGRPFRSLEPGRAFRLIASLSGIIARPLIKALPENAAFLRGASVTAVYRRPA